MKYALAIVQLAFGLAYFLYAITPVYPHGGGLDAYGCLSLGIDGYHISNY
jgi:hypothetical protein